VCSGSRGAAHAFITGRGAPAQDKMLCKRTELERGILVLNATTSEVRTQLR
jgi:hypothetical protein